MPKGIPKNSAKNLTKNHITISKGGKDIIVPMDRIENARLLILLGSEGRTLIQETLAKYKEKGMVLLPKELSEITNAMKNIREMCDSVFDKNPDLKDFPDKQVEKKEDAATDIDFSALPKEEVKEEKVEEVKAAE